MIIGALAGLAAAFSSGALPLPCAFRSIVVADRADQLLIACKDAPELYVLSSADGRTLRHLVLAGPAGVVSNNVAFAPNGRAAAVSWRDGTISIVGDSSAKPRTWRASFYANSLVFSPDGKRLYVDGTELETAAARPTGRSFRGEFDAPNAIAFDKSGRIAVVAEADTTLRLFDVGSGKQLRIANFDVEPLVADIDPETGEIIAGLADGTVARFDRQLHLIRIYRGVQGTMPVLMMSGRAHLLAALAPQIGGAQPTPWLLDYAAGKWAALPAAKDAIAAQRKGASIFLYKLRGPALVIEELQVSSK